MMENIEAKLNKVKETYTKTLTEAKNIMDELRIARVSELLKSGILEKIKFDAEFFGAEEGERGEILTRSEIKKSDEMYDKLLKIFGVNEGTLACFGSDIWNDNARFKLWVTHDKNLMFEIDIWDLKEYINFKDTNHLHVDESKLMEFLKDDVKTAKQKLIEVEDRLKIMKST